MPARVVGGVIVLGCLVAVVISLVDSRTRGIDLAYPIVIAALVSSIMWMVLLRPSVELSTEGVTLRNVLRDTDVPFDRVASLSHNWAFEVTDTAGQQHSSWAIPRERQLSPRRAQDDFADTTVRKRGRPGMTATTVVDTAERARSAWEVAGGQLLPGEHPAQQRWALEALIPLAASLVALLVLLIIG